MVYKAKFFWNVVGLFDVCGKVGEIPQSSLTPAVPQGGSAHGSRSVSTELQATHREVTSLCSRYSNCRCWPIGAAPEEFFPESFLLLLPLVAQSNPYHLPSPLGHRQPLRTLVSSQQERAWKGAARPCPGQSVLVLALPAVPKSTTLPFAPCQ